MGKENKYYKDFDKQSKVIEKEAFSIRDTIILKILEVLQINPSVTKASTIASSFKKSFKKLEKKISKTYDASIKSILKSDIAKDLTKNNIKKIISQKSVMLDDMGVVSARMVRDIKSAIISIVISEKPFKKAVKEVNKIYPNFAAQTETVFNSYLQRTYRDISFENQKEIGYPYYLYSGPLDSVTREYCKNHVNKIYTAEEAVNIQAEMQTFYNCRHELIGVWEN